MRHLVVRFAGVWMVWWFWLAVDLIFVFLASLVVVVLELVLEVVAHRVNVQLTVRLDEHLLQEIDALSHMLHVPRSEWLRMKLAEVVKDSIIKYREALALEYTMGHISFEELRTLIGRDADDVKLINDMTQKGKKEIDKLFEK